MQSLEYLTSFRDGLAMSCLKLLKEKGDLESRNHLKQMACRSYCSEHGSCQSGKCRCEMGYTGNDCSIDTNSPPHVYRIIQNDKKQPMSRLGGLCDLKIQPCKKIRLLVTNILDTEDLACITYPSNVSYTLYVDHCLA